MDNVDFDTSKPAEAPRLSIANLMLLTFFVAIGVAVVQNALPQISTYSAKAAEVATVASFGLTLGCCMGGSTILAIQSLRHRTLLFVAPGHYILICQAVGLLSWFGLLHVWYPDDNVLTVVPLLILPTAFQIAVLLIGIVMLSRQIAWRLCFGIAILFILCQLAEKVSYFAVYRNQTWNRSSEFLARASEYFEVVTAAKFPAIAVAGLFAIAIDVYFKRTRDWLHWLGLLTAVGVVCFMLYRQLARF